MAHISPTVHARALETSSSDHFRPDIQGLRALAVLLVVCAHASVPHLSGGYVGVDVFFVISGFVITGLLVREPPRTLGENLVHFYSRRIRRIVPAATLALIVTAFAAHHWLSAAGERPLLSDVRWASLFAANWHLIATNSNYFIPGLPPSLVTHFWSLAVEEQFYIVFPLIVFSLGIVVATRFRRGALAVVLLAAVAASSWWSIHNTPLSPVASYYSPFTRFWELGLGGLVALIPAAWTKRYTRINVVLGVGALAVLGASAVRLTDHSTYPGALAWWPCGAAAVLLIAGHSAPKGSPSWLLSRQPLRYIGDVSYGFYLWHFGWLMLPLQVATSPMSATSRTLQVAGAFACAVISYHVLENPIRRSKWLNGDNFATFMMLAACLLATWNVTLLLGRT